MGLFRLFRLFERYSEILREAAAHKLADTRPIRQLARICARFYVEKRGNLKPKVDKFMKFNSISELEDAAVNKLSDSSPIRQSAKTVAKIYVEGTHTITSKFKDSASANSQHIAKLLELIREIQKKVGWK